MRGNVWRLLDTRQRTASENMALDEVLLEARSRNLIPNTLHFMQFNPRAVLVGYHQSVENEVRVRYCVDNKIDVNRRLTGGGAIYFDETQLGWEIIASKSDSNIPDDVVELYPLLCEPVVRGLRELGIDAGFRPKNDIEVGGRKISGVGGTQMNDAFLFQGTLLMDFDVDTMLRALRIPVKKLSDKEVESVKDRVTCVREELGYLPKLSEVKHLIQESFEKSFSVSFMREYDLTECEKRLLKEKLPKFSSSEWVYNTRRSLPIPQTLYSVLKTPGGLIRVSLVLSRSRRIQSILITGDFFAFPKRTILDLEASLKNAKATEDNVKRIIHSFFREKQPQIPGVRADDFIKAVLGALGKMEYARYGVKSSEANKIFTVGGSFNDIMKLKCSLILIPYCSKLYDCGFRQEEDCIKCGKCDAGVVYEISEKFNIPAIGVCNFDHLMRLLGKYKADGVRLYIGFCCGAFYCKHQDELEDVGLSGILIDIEGDTCYDLGLEKEALKGEFKNQTALDVNLFKKILQLNLGGAFASTAV